MVEHLTRSYLIPFGPNLSSVLIQAPLQQQNPLRSPQNSPTVIITRPFRQSKGRMAAKSVLTGEKTEYELAMGRSSAEDFPEPSNWEEMMSPARQGCTRFSSCNTSQTPNLCVSWPEELCLLDPRRHPPSSIFLSRFTTWMTQFHQCVVASKERSNQV